MEVEVAGTKMLEEESPLRPRDTGSEAREGATMEAAKSLSHRQMGVNSLRLCNRGYRQPLPLGTESNNRRRHHTPTEVDIRVPADVASRSKAEGESPTTPMLIRVQGMEFYPKKTSPGEGLRSEEISRGLSASFNYID